MCGRRLAGLWEKPVLPPHRGRIGPRSTSEGRYVRCTLGELFWGYVVFEAWA